MQKTNICVVGTGYVGLVTGACLAEIGHRVVCVDSDRTKISALKEGRIPIYEHGLDKIVHKNVRKNRLFFCGSVAEGMRHKGKYSEAVFIAVGTPPRADGSADLSCVETVAQAVARNMRGYTLIVEKSTVPVETGEWIYKTVSKFNKKKIPFDVASNPEFLREGTAVKDFLKPDRIVFGVTSKRAENLMRGIYSPIRAPVLVTDLKSSELIKHASNSFLAAKISYINAVSAFCEKTGANISDVAKGMGLDKRIGPSFLNAGVGFGGFCLNPTEPVITRDPGGNIRLLPINRLYNETQTPKGVWEALSLDPGANKMQFKPITAVSRRPYQGNLVKIKTKMGKETTVTEDHPLLILSQKDWTMRLARELTLSDWAPFFLTMPSSPRHIQIDLIESLKAARPPFFQHIKVRPRQGKRWSLAPSARKRLLALTHGNSVRVYDIAVRGKPLSLMEFTELEQSGLLHLPHQEVEIGTAKGNATYVPATFQLTDDFCRLLGYLAAEGYISHEKSRRGIRERIIFHFHESEDEFQGDVESTLGQLGIRFTRFHVSQHHTKRIIVSSRIFAHLLRNILGCGTDSYTAAVPEAVLTSPGSARKAFLMGAYRGDGSVYYPSYSPAVTYDFGTVSEKMATGMISLAHSIGVVPSHQTGWGKKSTQPIHFLRISGATQTRFLNGVKGAQQESIILQRLTHLKKKIKPTGYKIVSPQVGAVRIVGIEKIPYKGLVYSMEVEGFETFSTGTGIILHNCFPKDLEAFHWISRRKGYDFKLLKDVREINEEQKLWMVRKVEEELWNLEGKTVAVLGLAFKPNTDDMRFAPSIDIISALGKRGVKVRAYDPVSMEKARGVIKDACFCKDPYECVKGADCLALVTEWDEFKKLDFKKVKSLMKHPVIMDGRNLYDPGMMRKLGFTYKSVGRP